ncbi:MAG: hypothetical protein M1812_006584 [Candelaria pacifica]|nr:MAG: hypothetical protein M1812_006584 [Candelaria pacifica]
MYHVHLPHVTKPHKVYIRIHEQAHPKFPSVVMKVAGGWQNFKTYLEEQARDGQKRSEEQARDEQRRADEQAILDKEIARKEFLARLGAIVPFEKFFDFPPELRTVIISKAMSLDTLAHTPARPFKYRKRLLTICKYPGKWTVQFYFPSSDAPTTMALLRANKRLSDEASFLLYSRTRSFWFSTDIYLRGFLSSLRPKSINLIKRISLYFEPYTYLYFFNADIMNSGSDYYSSHSQPLKDLNLDTLRIIFPHPSRMHNWGYPTKCHYRVCKCIVKAVKNCMKDQVKTIEFEGGLFTNEQQAQIDIVIEKYDSFTYGELVGMDPSVDGREIEDLNW